MKKLLLIGYLIITTILAYPTVLQMYYDLTDETSSEKSLMAGGSDEQWEFLKDVAKLIEYADSLGYKLTAGEMYRTMYQQRHNVAIGVSWTYNSRHLRREAVDFNLFVDGEYTTNCSDYEVLGAYWESLNPKNRFGGRFNDPFHFERMDSEMSYKYRSRPLCK